MVDFLRQDKVLTPTEAEALFSAREIEVLRLLGAGRAAKETAGLTEATVAIYRKQAFKKLGVHKLPVALNKLHGEHKVVKSPETDANGDHLPLILPAHEDEQDWDQD